MKKIINIIILLFVFAFANSQNTITGTFPKLANQKVKLTGFNGFQTYGIDSTRVNEAGEFTLKYSTADYGMGYLMTEDNKLYLVILYGEDIQLKGETFAFPETIEILEGNENQIFEQYASEHPRREQVLSAWIYLEKIYRQDPLFSIHETPKHAIAKEKKRVKAEDSLFLAGLNPQTYINWYLPLRKLVSSTPTVAQYRTEEIPASIAAFRNINYSDQRLYKSGLLKDAIESHFWLIENSGRSLDSVYIEMNISIDSLVESLLEDEDKLNEITEYLFKLLEKRSLFVSSEYLALKLLNINSCTIDTNFAAQLESYRAMKTGNTAPDFAFKKDRISPGYAPADAPKKLSDIKSKYTVLVFGASWCPQCPEDLLQIARLYEKWKQYNVEVVFVSLDEDEKMFKRFAGAFPFISVCDYQKWESPIIEAYHIFATPTIFLLDDNRTILLRPNSVSQLDSWVDWYLVERNM